MYHDPSMGLENVSNEQRATNSPERALHMISTSTSAARHLLLVTQADGLAC